MKASQHLTNNRLCELLERMRQVRVALLGDLCLDVYWFADMTRSRLSRETPHFPLPVMYERMSAGAGGNVVSDLALLSDHLIPLGVLGSDWRGACLREVFASQGISTEHILQINGRITNAYCKPMRRGYAGIDVEDPRIDFESFEPLPREIEDQLIARLDEIATRVDLLCVSDQFEFGCVSKRVREKINELACGGLLCVVDSRSHICDYRHCILKPNEIECARALGYPDDYLHEKKATDEQIRAAASALCERTDSDVCLTLGERGCLILSGANATRVGSIHVAPPIDIVGAGDCFLSAFSLALAAGAEDAEAGCIGALASAVCVRKINTTGSASREEILSLYRETEG
ncbi:MAG: sugar kinase [Ruminococcaceae bacterium]|nr:sugar kinase [Oscillospiraceae bacterium]